MTKVTSLSTLIMMKLNAKHQYNKIINKADCKYQLDITDSH